MDTPLRKDQESPLRGVRANILCSPFALSACSMSRMRPPRWDTSFFFYANLAHAQTKQDVLDLIAQQFTFPSHFGKNFDALSDCLTDPLHKSGPQPGFIVVLEQIPATVKFDKEAREQLLDVFRDVADYWSDRKIPFRCFYSFSVARSATLSQAERGERGYGTPAPVQGIDMGADVTEKMPTDKLVEDIFCRWRCA